MKGGTASTEFSKSKCMKFEFATATQIIFGAGRLSDVGMITKGLGKRALVVTGRTPGRAEKLLELLRKEGIEGTPFRVAGEPEVETVLSGILHARQNGCDLVISMGGAAL